MTTPVFVRPMLDGERQALEAGLRSPDAFVLRRCQILLPSARSKRVPESARDLGCSDDAVLSAIHAFNEGGLHALEKGSSRPHTIHAAFNAQDIERLRASLRQSPPVFDKATSLWTLDLLADAL
ncbi:MAG: helix-turn-helix domain-containing protein [Anaerolineae bacterium]